MPVRKKSHSRKKRFKTQKAQNVRKRTRSKYIKKLRRKSILIGGLRKSGELKKKREIERKKRETERTNRATEIKKEREKREGKRKREREKRETERQEELKRIAQIKRNQRDEEIEGEREREEEIKQKQKEVEEGQKIKGKRKKINKKHMVVGEPCPSAAQNKQLAFQVRDEEGNDIFIQCKESIWDKVDSNNVENRNGKFVLRNPAESGTYIDVDGVVGMGIIDEFEPEDLSSSSESSEDSDPP